MAKSLSYRRHSKFKRVVLGALSGLSAMVVFLAIILGKFFEQQTQSIFDYLHALFGGWWILGFLIWFFFLVYKSVLSYKKLTYDPTWGIKLQEIFDGMYRQRAMAAKTLKDHRDKLSKIDEHGKLLSPIDDVLNFFSDVAFYTKHDQISPEVAWNQFYDTLRGYWIAAKEYVYACRKDEPKVWDSIEALFETLLEIEVGKEEDKKIQEIAKAGEENDDFLDVEIRLLNENLKRKQK